MLRATGFHRIEAAIQTTRRNIRDAKWSVVWNAPSFIQAKRSYQSLYSRVSVIYEGFPISKLLHRQSVWSSANLSRQQAAAIETTGQVVMFSSAGYLVLNHNVTARSINAAAVSAAVVFRGIRTLVDTFWDCDDQESVWSAGAGFLQGATGGILLIGLTVVGMWCRKRDTMVAPAKWFVRPFQYVESLIDKLVVVMDKIV